MKNLPLADLTEKEKQFFEDISTKIMFDEETFDEEYEYKQYKQSD